MKRQRYRKRYGTHEKRYKTHERRVRKKKEVKTKRANKTNGQTSPPKNCKYYTNKKPEAKTNKTKQKQYKNVYVSHLRELVFVQSHDGHGSISISFPISGRQDQLQVLDGDRDGHAVLEDNQDRRRLSHVGVLRRRGQVRWLSRSTAYVARKYVRNMTKAQMFTTALGSAVATKRGRLMLPTPAPPVEMVRCTSDFRIC